VHGALLPVWHQIMRIANIRSVSKAQGGDAIQMISLHCGAHGRLTGMDCDQRLVKSLINALAAHQRALRLKLQGEHALAVGGAERAGAALEDDMRLGEQLWQGAHLPRRSVLVSRLPRY
jgi:hypothetical protein